MGALSRTSSGFLCAVAASGVLGCGNHAGSLSGVKPVGGDAGASSTACTTPTLPTYAQLTSIASLPDPFLSLDGTRVSSMGDWACRRAEISAEMQRWELGVEPPAPETLSGAVSGNDVTVTATHNGQTISFTATITPPTSGQPPYPAMINIGAGGTSLNGSILAQQGVALIAFPNDDLAQEDSASSRGQGMFYTLYGGGATAGAMVAWAWGVSRLIDVLEQNPSANIDVKRLGVTGCSRDGKGALVVGALEERIALTIPQESGSGGAGSWRVSDAVKASGANTQTLAEIVGENVWFQTGFATFSGHTNLLPFDHHELEGLVAPRALLVIENTIDWLGPLSTYTASVAANTIWQALGVPDHQAYTENGGSGGHVHCQLPTSQQPDVDAYVQKFLIGGGTANTAFQKQDDGLTYDAAMWQPWSVPTPQ